MLRIMSKHYVKVTFEENEFAEKFPAIAKMNLADSDKVRVALGLKPRNASVGAPKGNKNAVGNKGRWSKEDSK